MSRELQEWTVCTRDGEHIKLTNIVRMVRDGDVFEFYGSAAEVCAVFVRPSKVLRDEAA